MEHTTRRKRFALALVCGCAFMLLGIWLSSGTMAPYASTLRQPRIVKPCNYLLNTDNDHFEGTFLMLDGAPREKWKFSIVLRRILYPLLAYPLMKLFGFLVGGVATSMLLNVTAFVLFVLYVRRRIGPPAALAAIVLLATYPGIYYWAGLPYAYAAIVPASLGAIVILMEVERNPSFARVALLSLALGILLLAYDHLPFFGPPLVLILLLRKRWVAAAVACALIVLPTLLTNVLLVKGLDLPLMNQNTLAYRDVISAYTRVPNFSLWRRALSGVPLYVVVNFFTCNLVFLPALFLALFVINRFTLRLKLTRAELGVAAMAIVLFAFLNLAPPHEGWQFRGIAMGRIYQPVFVVFLMFTLRIVQAVATLQNDRPTLRRWVYGLLGAAAVANASVVLGPVLGLRHADHIYFNFYRHATEPHLSRNLELFGRRPLGFCDTSITIENPRRRMSAAEKQQRKLMKLRPKRPVMTKAQKERKRQREAEKRSTTQPAPTTPATATSAPAAAPAPSPDG